MAITREQIFEAADRLAADGQRPTLEAVRQITGGSYTTISPALNEWKARQATAATPLRESAPQAVADRLAEVGAEVWAMALDLANGRLAAEREALERVRADLETAQAEAAELADKLAGEVEELQIRCVELETCADQAKQQTDELRGQLVIAQQQVHTAEARAQEIERRAGELRTELDRAHQAADQIRSERDQVRAELVKVQATAKAEREAYQEQRKQAATEVHRQAERLTAAQAERDQARKAAAAAREDAARLAGQLQAHQEQTAAILARLAPPTAAE